MTPQQRNPAAGIYTGADSFGNPASLLITPDGYYASVVSPKDSVGDVLSVSTAQGYLTTIVFTSRTLYTHDLSTGDASVGTLVVNYQQSVSSVNDLAYPFGTRTIGASFLAYSFGTPTPPSNIRATGTGTLYLPRTSAPHEARSASWSLNQSQLTFTVEAGACVLSARVSQDPSINVLAASASHSAGCGLGASAVSGYLWRDEARSYAYAVLNPSGQPSASPVVIAIKL